MNLYAINTLGLAQTEMQAPLILRTEAAAARHLLPLLLTIPKDPHIGSDCAAIAAASDQIELDPLVARIDMIFIKQNGAFLISDNRVERTRVTEIGKRDRAAVIAVRDADHLRDFLELASTIVHPNAFLLESG